MSYDANVLVNGSRCKQYNHDGKIFIEAKHGSEYAIEIKNNTWARILAVCSVDGLDILDGKTAAEGNPGYVINQLGSSKFDGFRVSNEKVAKFVFSTKDASYAADKGDNSERNVGVIGIRLFSEKEKPLPKVTEIHHHHNHWRRHTFNDWETPLPPYNPPIIWCDTTYSTSTCGPMQGSDDGCLGFMGDMMAGSQTYSCNNIPTKGGPSAPTGGEKIKKSVAGGQSSGIARGLMDGSTLKGRVSTQNASFMSNPMKSVEPKGFDMGTKWGEAKESKVVEVEFERGVLTLTKNIYYASRQSLIEMGIPLGNEKQVSFPEPFKDSKYSKPPKNWKG